MKEEIVLFDMKCLRGSLEVGGKGAYLGSQRIQMPFVFKEKTNDVKEHRQSES